MRVPSRKGKAQEKMNMAHIDYYFATISPYAYLAGSRLEEVAAKHGATLTYKPLDLIALFARTGGTLPKDRHASRVEYRAQELQRQARKLGMPFNLQPAHWPTNMAPSSYAVIAAQNAGGGDMGKLCQGILRACWSEEKDIAEDAVIKSCLEAAGFDSALADSGLLVGAETYAANLEDAVEHGVFGSPFYVTDDGQRFWGQDRLPDLDMHLAGQTA
jgi:2-hydroxychromene-2-carboxylate isomerase